MGMEVHYKHISPWLLDRFKENEALVEPFVVLMIPNMDDGVPAHIKQKIRATTPDSDFDPVMQGIINNIAGGDAPRILEETRGQGLCLGKAFQIIQFHLSGETADHGISLLSKAVTGDQDIGINLGYGPATFLTAEQVSDIVKALSEVSEGDFLNKYKPKRWGSGEGVGALTLFKKLKNYYSDASRLGNAMLVWGG